MKRRYKTVNEKLEKLRKKIERTSEKVEPSVESLLGKTVFKAKIADQYRIDDSGGRAGSGGP